MFNIVQQLVPNWYFVVVVRHKELEERTAAGTKFKFTITIFKFSSISVLFSNVCSLPVVGVEIGVVENR